MTHIELPPSIANYRTECQRILGWLNGGWLADREFDALSIEAGPEVVGERWYTPESIVFPMRGDPRLALLQEMMRAGLVEARKSETGTVEYRHVG